MSALGPGGVKTHLSRGRAELFSQLSSRRRSRGAIGFHNDEIETEILRAGSTSEFSHSLGQKPTSGGFLPMSATPPEADIGQRFRHVRLWQPAKLRDTMQKQIFRVGAGPRFCQLLRVGYAACGSHQQTQLNKTGRPRFGDSVDPNQGLSAASKLQ